MPNTVSNTGPILALAHIEQFELLRKLFGAIIIPPSVRNEIKDAISLAAVNQAIAANWLTVQAAQDALAVQLLNEELDAGESEAIILSKELPADLVLIDERAATRKARSLGLRVIGTLGVLLMGKQAGHITAVRPLLDHLLTFGFRMSTDLYEQVLKDANESV